MSEDHIEPNPMQVAYNAALMVAGRDAANAVLKAHGVKDSAPHGWRRVPAAKELACLAALTKLAGDNGGKQRKAAAPTRMERIAASFSPTSARRKSASPHRLQSDLTRRRSMTAGTIRRPSKTNAAWQRSPFPRLLGIRP